MKKRRITLKQLFHHTFKRILSAGVAGALILSLTSCGTEINNISMGRFVERNTNFSSGEIIEMATLMNGNLRIVTTTGIYDSSDQGLTWSLWERQPAELAGGFSYGPIKNDTALRVGVAAISKDGEIFYAAKIQDDITYHYVDSKGRNRIFEIMDANISVSSANPKPSGKKSKIHQAIFSDSGDLLCSDSQNIYQIDKDTLTVKHIYPASLQNEQGEVERFVFCTVGNQIFVFTAEKKSLQTDQANDYQVTVTVYQLGNETNLGNQMVMSEFIESELGGHGNLYENIIFSSSSDRAVYFANSTGIYRYPIDGTTVEKIFDGALGQMSNPARSLALGAVTDKDCILLCYDSRQIIQYAYDPNVLSTPEKLLSIYALYDDPAIRQVISEYQRQNPNILVELLIGISPENKTSRAEALNALDETIRSHNGPDLFWLDGMPVNSYIEQGILADLSDVVKQVDSEQPLFKNILSCHKKDGAYWAVPTRFAVPIMAGNADILDSVKNLNDLASLFEIQRQEHPDANAIMGNISASNLLLILMPSSSPVWLKKNGTLDEEALKDFFIDAKRIQDSQKCDEKIVYSLDEHEYFNQAPYMSGCEYMTDESGFSGGEFYVANIRTNLDLKDLISKLKTLKNSGYKSAPGQSQGTYIPIDLAGVSAESANKELAMDFMKFLLQEAQDTSKFNLTDGWPVNKAAFEKTKQKPEHFTEGIRTVHDDSGEGMYELNFIWPSENDFDKFRELVEELSVPSLTDESITRTIFLEGAEFMTGKMQISDTIESIAEKIGTPIS